MNDDIIARMQLKASRRAHDATFKWLAGMSAWAVIATFGLAWSLWTLTR